jgi:hypothetical protein
MELPEKLQVIDRFERQRLAERISLIDLRVMMINLARAYYLRKAHWNIVDSSALGADLKP